PIQAAVTSPSGGTITITRSSSTTGTPGFMILTGSIHIDAPSDNMAPNPLRLVFDLDASVIPPDEDQNTVEITKDGVSVPACTGNAGEASPDPCVSSRTVLPNTNVEIVVLTTTASDWQFAASVCGTVPAAGCS